MRWTKKDLDDQYFQKESQDSWVEYQNGEKFADFKEIRREHNTVVLRKYDGLFIKLTEDMCFFGDEDDICNFLTYGYWSNQTSFKHNNISYDQQQQQKQDSELIQVQEIYNKCLKFVHNEDFSSALNEISKADDVKLKECKDTLQKVLESTNQYYKLITEANKQLNNNNFDEARRKFNQAFKFYQTISEDRKILELFKEADLSIVENIKKKKSETNGYIELLEMMEKEEKTKKVKNIPNEQVEDKIEDKRLDKIYENVLKNVSYMKFSDALEEIEKCIEMKPNNQKFKTTKELLEKIVKKSNIYNSLLAEGISYISLKEFNLAKEKLDKSLIAYMEITHDPQILALFRDANLEISKYINGGNNQVNELLYIIKKNGKSDDDVEELYSNALRAIKTDMNYKKAFEYFNKIALLKNKDINVQPEIDCLNRLQANLDKYFELNAKGYDLLLKNEYNQSIELFSKASEIYLELISNAIFNKLHNGDLSDYLKANKAEVNLNNAKEKKASQNLGNVINNDDFWGNVDPIGDN